MFKISEGETEHITLHGSRVRDSTVLIHLGGGVSFSHKALKLGCALFACQVFDGILTYFGLTMLGVGMEGNQFLRRLMEAYGAAPVLFAIKTGAVALVVTLTFHAHKRRWIRPLIFMLIAIYLLMAVLPWI